MTTPEGNSVSADEVSVDVGISEASDAICSGKKLHKLRPQEPSPELNPASGQTQQAGASYGAVEIYTVGVNCDFIQSLQQNWRTIGIDNKYTSKRRDKRQNGVKQNKEAQIKGYDVVSAAKTE
ncbi:hypothetical protein P7K49_012457 [Saguinus oedipus]|uniref:Uncharacterized protein n=1 Tax=Saguinus oedipus TaxID=9490 RepID=A0ABQ9VUA3_SAGOE|nr:hypothetical protein P7K49_012457 [Saguinus oedipus]